jgi:hypothetical protein
MTGDDGMVVRPGNVVLDAADPEGLASFWAALTGYEPRVLFPPFVGLRDPTGVGPNLTFQAVSGLPSRPSGGCHIDLYVDDPSGAAARAEQLGARIVRRVDEREVHWIVLTDPEGHEFCLVAAIGPDRVR